MEDIIIIGWSNSIVTILFLAPMKYIVLSSKEYESRDSPNSGYVLFVNTNVRSFILVTFLLNMLWMLLLSYCLGRDFPESRNFIPTKLETCYERELHLPSSTGESTIRYEAA